MSDRVCVDRTNYLSDRVSLKKTRRAFVAAARLCIRCCGVVARSLFQNDLHAWFCARIAQGRFFVLECLRTLDFWHKLHKKGGLRPQICKRNVDFWNGFCQRGIVLVFSLAARNAGASFASKLIVAVTVFDCNNMCTSDVVCKGMI